jgi:hypothetical protein
MGDCVSKAVVVVLLFLIIVQACNPSLSQIRNSNPDIILDSNKTPKSVANCITYKFQGGYTLAGGNWDHTNISEQEGIYHTTTYWNAGGLGGQVQPAFETTIKPNGRGGSTIEIRIGAGNPLKSIQECI